MTETARHGTAVMHRKTSGITISRDNFTFSSAHFAQLPGGTSERLNGHNYSVTIEVTDDVDALGFIVDFALLKQVTLEITSKLNHKVLIPRNSDRLSTALIDDEIEIRVDKKRYVFPESDVALLPVRNTTCEELSSFILDSIATKVNFRTLAVYVMESPTQGARSILERTSE